MTAPAPVDDGVPTGLLPEAGPATSCDHEHIRTPGAIQPHGVLLAMRETDSVITWISANAGDRLGVDAAAALGLRVQDVLGTDMAQRLGAAIADSRASGIEPLHGRTADGSAYELTWHRVDAQVVIEVEVRAKLDVSTMTTLFADVRHATGALHAASSVRELCDAAARAVRDVTGYDRVMVYRFHPDDHGEVVAEACDPSLVPFLGLHYPAGDIPVQARNLYLLNPLRMLVDVGYEPVALLGDPVATAGEPLDLSHALLRSMSPTHLEYLRNMGVGATLTISLMRGARLWGLIACHHDTPMSIGPQRRAACRLLGQMFSLQVVAAEELERNAYRTRLAAIGEQIVTRLSAAGCLATALAEGDPSPLRLTDADGLFARIDGVSVSVGVVPPERTVLDLVAGLEHEADAGPFVCDDLPHRDVGRTVDPAVASGALVLALTPGGGDVVVWFRGELVHTVQWGGDPEKVEEPGAPGERGRIIPRKSFAAWGEQVRGHSRPWLQAEVDAATALAAAIPELLLARVRDRLAHLALHDPLTGLPNRSLLVDRIEQALGRAGRPGGRPAVLFVDLDRFKRVNDGWGHAAGDALLRQVATRLVAETRDEDTVARLGGDEFVVLCDQTSEHHAQRLADRLVRAFRAAFLVDGRDVATTVSVGVAVAGPGDTPASLLRGADAAMYRAKHSGRNAAAIFTPEMSDMTTRTLEIETALRPALERGDLRLHFQPLLTIDGSVTGFEALARWPLEGRGMVPPSEFIPVALATGLMGPLTAWALGEGLRELVRWRALPGLGGLTLSVNVAAGHFSGDDLLGVVTDALRRHRLPAEALCLEITEGELLADDTSTREVLTRLRRLGVALSIDDFGTGFSSLAYLGRLPVQEVKIDRAFISGLPGNHSDNVVVASVVGIAHELGMHTVAEGVETEEQLAAVRRLGCDRVQGYLLARPMPAEEIDRFLADARVLPARVPPPRRRAS